MVFELRKFMAIQGLAVAVASYITAYGITHSQPFTVMAGIFFILSIWFAQKAMMASLKKKHGERIPVKV